MIIKENTWFSYFIHWICKFLRVILLPIITKVKLFSTFVCPTEILSFNENRKELNKIGADVVVCSTDSHFCHLGWSNLARDQGGVGPLDIPMLSDKSLQISRSYGVLRDDGCAWRGLFIIDGKQILRQITVNDMQTARSTDETIRLIKTIQTTDKEGETCPIV